MVIVSKSHSLNPSYFPGSVLGFNVDRQTGFDIPLNYVSQCTTQKNEAILEFHPNDEAAVSLMEMRFYIPQEGAEGDPVEVRRNSKCHYRRFAMNFFAVIPPKCTIQGRYHSSDW